jgi:hypothetical protein
MNILMDLPAGAVPADVLTSIAEHVVADVESYAAARRNDVARGAETVELAAVLVDKYGAGLAKALSIVGVDSSVQEATDCLVRSIDPDFEAHRAARWRARPAGIST